LIFRRDDSGGGESHTGPCAKGFLQRFGGSNAIFWPSTLSGEDTLFKNLPLAETASLLNLNVVL
jgi:hypothetical protein